MPITFDQAQLVLGRRLGPCVALADLHEALGYALASLGYPPVDRTALVTADFALLTAGGGSQLLDVAEWRAVEAILGNLCDEEVRKIGLTSTAAQLRLLYETRLARLYLYLRNTYGVGAAELQVGLIKANFQQQDDPADSPRGF